MATLDRYKLSSVTWDSDKEPTKFTDFMYLMSAMVRALAHGQILEAYLDRKLQRQKFNLITTPGFLSDDPEFQRPPEAPHRPEPQDDEDEEEPEFEVGSGDVESVQFPRSAAVGSAATGSTQLNATGTNYFDLPDGARVLDAQLYNVLCMSIKGSKRILLECVQFPSYIQGICVMYRHADISKNDRITRAFDDMDKLAYNGDVLKWQSDAVKKIRELFDSKASIMHYVLSRIMKSFDGKLKTIQYKIAEDINSRVVDDSTNVFDMVQAYATDIASVGDSKHSGALNINTDVKCTYCHNKGHLESDCRKKKNAGGKAKGKKGGGGKGSGGKGGGKGYSDYDCHYCGKKGHISRDCAKKKAERSEGDAAAPAPAPAPVNNTQPAPAGYSQQQGLTALLEHLRRPPAAVNCVTPAVASGEQLRVGPWGYKGQRVGEASHPGPLVSQTMMAAVAVQCIVLSLCDGMGCGALALKGCSATLDRYIAVEVEPAARRVAQVASPSTTTFPGIDHGWHDDVHQIQEQDIKDLGSGAIKLLLFGAPCEDMSKLRLLVSNKQKKHSGDPRPGLDGKRGMVFRRCIQVLQWVLKYNPDCEYFIENVVFTDMPSDWHEVCQALGDPVIVNAELYSFTKRNRAYWSNYLEAGQLPPPTPGNPNCCMDPGRTVQTYLAYNKPCVRPVGKSWCGDPQRPKAATSLPILVNDELYDKPQQLRPVEAERLMGMPANCTESADLTPLDRLRAIGNGWDVNVTTMLLAQSKFVKHLSPQRRDAEALTLVTQQLLVEQHRRLGDRGMAELLSGLPAEHLDQYLVLLMEWYSGGSDESVLDSGSARHLQRATHVTDVDNRMPLTGFDGSVKWTEGNGYLPIHVQDEYTGETVALDVTDCDKMGSELVVQILSLGKLLRDGYEFHLAAGGRDCYALTPGGAHRLKIDLGHDDLLRMQHSIRNGQDCAPLPQLPAKALALRRSAADATASFLHDVLNHTSMEKIFRTLQVTHGYKAVRLPQYHCSTCAMAKARSFGLKQKVVPQPVAMANEMDPVDPVFDDDTSSDNGSDDEQLPDEGYVAPVAGRSVGIQAVPRFQLYKIKFCEVMFVDDKDFPCAVRGGAVTALVFIDYKSRLKLKVDLSSKKHNGSAFEKMVALIGAHKQPYHCRVFTDGCGSMKHVADCAQRMGIDHQYVPPHQQSLNEAEKVCDHAWESARALMVHSAAPEQYFALAVSYVLYVDARSATTSNRDWLTPFEMAKEVRPDIARLHRFYTRCYVTVPKAKRKQLAKKGLHNVRAEPGRLLGFHGPFSSTYAVMLDGPGERLVHSIDVTFDDSDFTVSTGPDAPPASHHLDLSMGGVREEAKDEHKAQAASGATGVMDAPSASGSPNWMDAPVDVEHLLAESPAQYFDPDDDAWKTHAGQPQPRPRPSYSFAVHDCFDQQLTDESEVLESQGLNQLSHQNQHVLTCMLDMNAQQTEAFDACLMVLNENSANWTTYQNSCLLLALHAQKDMSWKEILKSDQADQAIAALERELESLTSTILIPLDPSHPEYQDALRLATPGRVLLDVKRSGIYKARAVKQGFKEDKEQADGPDFNYYAHVAKLISIRTAIFRPNRHTRRLALKDVKTAFLQADKFPDDVVKYLSIKHPVTLETTYYRQIGPLYGEASAPVRWEATIASWMQTQEYVRGDNEPCAYLHPDRDLLTLMYVDDSFHDGEEDEINWILDRMDERFKCQPAEWLHRKSPLDLLGMWVSTDELFTYISMPKYIRESLDTLGFANLRPVSVPMNAPVDGDSEPLDSSLKRLFLTAVGILGWLVVTCRPDVAYAHSRISQHMAAPTQSAWTAVKRCFAYLKATAELGLAAPLHSGDSDTDHWEFYSDSDFAGNDEPQNKRRSQNGCIATLNGAPVLWSSKVSSVAFAHPDIGEAHADTSSTAAEIYAAANATHEIMHLSYISSEMGIAFPQPFILQVDNAAAKSFADQTSFKSRLKHIDTRQEWVKTLRDKNICKTEYVNTKSNLADLFTKILPTDDFVRLRDRIMVMVPSAEE